MQLIVLTGMNLIERAALCVALAQHFITAGQTVRVLDNMVGTSVDCSTLPEQTCVQIKQQNLAQLAAFLTHYAADVSVLAASQQLHPDDMALHLLNLEAALPALQIHQIALIDERTESCFPYVGQALIENADRTCTLPCSVQEILEVL